MVANEKSCGPTAPDGFKYVPPDGGFGWWVLFGSCLAIAIVAIPLYSFGFIFGDILITMNTTTSTCSWIPSLYLSSSLLIAPVVNIIITKYSCRVATICGGIFSAVGMILSYFATNVVVLFLTNGVICGVGFGFVMSSALLALSQYFRVHYGLVTGIFGAFIAVGRLIFSPLIQFMLEFMDYHSLFLVLGAMSLNVCVGGALFQPSVWHQKLVANPPDSLPGTGTDIEHTDIANGSISNGVVDNGKNTTTGNGSLRSRPSSSSLDGRVTEPAAVWLLQSEVMNQAEPEVRLASAADIFGSVQSVALNGDCDKMAAVVTDNSRTVEEAGCYSWWKTGPFKLDVKLLTEPIFHVLLWGGIMGLVVVIYQGVYLPSLMVENGLLPMQAAAATSLTAGGEIVGRILAPYLLEHYKIPLLFFILGLNILQVVILVVITFVTSFAGIAVAVVLSGLAHGGNLGLTILIFVDSVGYGRLPSIIALTRFLQGILVVGVGPIMGSVKDLVGAFDGCFYFLTVVQFFSCLVWALQPLAKRKSFLT